MQATSTLYQELLESPHWKETRLDIGEPDILGTELYEAISFGSDCISIGDSGSVQTYDESSLISINTSKAVFSKGVPAVGCCVSGEIRVEMLMPSTEIPRQARLTPFVRLANGVHCSEWIQKGVYYIDTRAEQRTGSSVVKIVLHGFDDMLKAEQNYPPSSLQWPAVDIDVVQEIANFLGVMVDERTRSILHRGYRVQYPGEYTCRETLGYIASMYAGCFVMSDMGELRLIVLNGIPEETRYLVTSSRQAITFGGDRILV